MSSEEYINKLRREYNIVNTLNQDRIDITRDEITTAPSLPQSPRSTRSTRSNKSNKSTRSVKSTRSNKSNRSTRSVKSNKSTRSNKSTKSTRSNNSNRSTKSNKSTRSTKSMRSTTESVKNILMGIENELEEDINYVNETNETSRTNTDNREVMNEREEDGVVDNLFNLDDIIENNTNNNTNDTNDTNDTNNNTNSNTNNNTHITQSLVLEKEEQEINDDLISDNDSTDSENDYSDSDSTDSINSANSMELFDELDYESDFDESKRRMIVRKENKNPKILREKRQMILRLSRFKSRGRVGIPDFKLDRNTYREIKMIFDDEIADIKLTSDIEFYRFIIIAAIFIVEFVTKKIKLDWFEGWCDKLLMNPSKFDISIENTISCNPKLYGDVNPVMKLFTEIAYDGLILAAGNCFKKVLKKTNRKVEISPPDETAVMLNARINSRSTMPSF